MTKRKAASLVALVALAVIAVARLAADFTRRLRRGTPWAADQMQFTDNFEVILRGPDGEIKQHLTGHNLVTTVGKEKLIERQLAAPATEGPKYLAIGTGGVEAKISDTTLGAEVKRKEATVRSVAANVLTLSVTFGPGEGEGEIKEAGSLSAAAVGTLFARFVFAVVNKAAGDSLEIKWTLTGS